MTELTHRVAAAVYVFRDDRLLLLKRVAPPQTFAPPGGRLNINEDPVSGALREAQEECGMDVEIFGVAQTWFGVYAAGTSPILCINYLAESFRGEPQLSGEHTEYVWVSRDDLESGRIVTVDENGNGYRKESFLEAFEKYKAWKETGKR